MLTLDNYERLSELYSGAGIYAFRNIQNNKYYIGLSLNIKKRVKQHIRTFINNVKPDYPVYKAFNKYGLDNFEVILLYMESDNLTKQEIKSKLDILEHKFIILYNSYGSTGYNQTYGGDGGILGYKFNKQQCQKQKDAMLKIANDGRYKLFVYNIADKSIHEYKSLKDASVALNIKIFRSSTRNLIFHDDFIIESSLEMLNNKIKLYNDMLISSNAWRNGYSKKIPDNFESYYLLHTGSETKKYFNISSPTLYKWCRKLNIKKISDIDESKVLQLYNLYGNKSKVGKELNIDRLRVLRILKKYNIN